jgi:uncharacterized lipoprotein YajG
MRILRTVIILAPLVFAAACGSTEKTVVVNPPADSTTVVDANGNTHVIKHDQ